MKYRIVTNECGTEFRVQFKQWWWLYWDDDVSYYSIGYPEFNNLKTFEEAIKRVRELKMKNEPLHTIVEM